MQTTPGGHFLVIYICKLFYYFIWQMLLKKECISSKSKQSKSAQGKGTRRKSRKKFINKFIRKSKKSKKSKKKSLNF